MVRIKKFLSVLLVGVLLVLNFSTIADAKIIYRDAKGYVLTDDKCFSYEVVDEEVVIWGYYGSEGNVVFPDEIEGFPVTRIGFAACGDNKTITSIVVPDTVTTIEDDAFHGCENLEHIKLSDNIEYMGYWVFWGTKWYEQFSAGDLIYIDKVLYEFKMVSGYKPAQPEVLVIKDGTKCIAGDALRYLSETKEITIPDSVISIGKSAFNQIENLEIVNLGSGIKHISEYAFVNCDNLTSVNYNASKLHWNNVDVLDYNEPLLNAIIVFNDIDHTADIAEIKEPTCVNEGYTVYNCACGEKLVGNKLDKLSHNYAMVKTDPTCVDDGSVVYTCSCGDTYTETLDATGHTDSGWIIDTVSTCTSEGAKHMECIVCGETLKTEAIAKLSHSYNSVVMEATCEKGGYTTFTCACGDTYIADNTSATGHNYVEGVCITCGESKIDNCSCNCHKSGFMNFIWKIINFFNKLFKSNEICACGVVHY